MNPSTANQSSLRFGPGSPWDPYGSSRPISSWQHDGGYPVFDDLPGKQGAIRGGNSSLWEKPAVKKLIDDSQITGIPLIKDTTLVLQSSAVWAIERIFKEAGKHAELHSDKKSDDLVAKINSRLELVKKGTGSKVAQGVILDAYEMLQELREKTKVSNPSQRIQVTKTQPSTVQTKYNFVEPKTVSIDTIADLKREAAAVSHEIKEHFGGLAQQDMKAKTEGLKIDSGEITSFCRDRFRQVHAGRTNPDRANAGEMEFLINEIRYAIAFDQNIANAIAQSGFRKETVLGKAPQDFLHRFARPVQDTGKTQFKVEPKPAPTEETTANPAPVAAALPPEEPSAELKEAREILSRTAEAIRTHFGSLEAHDMVAKSEAKLGNVPLTQRTIELYQAMYRAVTLDTDSLDIGEISGLEANINFNILLDTRVAEFLAEDVNRQTDVNSATTIVLSRMSESAELIMHEAETTITANDWILEGDNPDTAKILSRINSLVVESFNSNQAWDMRPRSDLVIDDRWVCGYVADRLAIMREELANSNDTTEAFMQAAKEILVAIDKDIQEAHDKIEQLQKMAATNAHDPTVHPSWHSHMQRYIRQNQRAEWWNATRVVRTGRAIWNHRYNPLSREKPTDT